MVRTAVHHVSLCLACLFSPLQSPDRVKADCNYVLENCHNMAPKQFPFRKWPSSVGEHGVSNLSCALQAGILL